MSSSHASSSSSSKRRPSLPSDSSETVISTLDNPAAASKKVVSPFIKHGKYVVLGLGGCWWTDLPNAIARVLDTTAGKGGESDWVRKVMLLGLGLHGTTVFIFLYLVLFLPWLRGYIPNYREWQQSPRLSLIVPVLTATILLGWTSLVVSLSQAGKRTMFESAVDAVKAVGNGSLEQMQGGKGLGVFKSMVAATALYTLTIGVLGLIPTPAGVPIRDKSK
ncbi:hypothetical protein I317_01982 [Kwoniella heveanensis CBS 569]|uniref:Uncharacterized protein n=1 Tax=Kwoniella heveanensis BCC8398 TaxID=1296120 RepID=A0A1B9GZE8_9TREE|nr:hypothetical protein I316_01657 [Kwoniella heveanensis BCC8398]OCF44190.1 hypothetical protein I317_01982 [Kwoniella heveanensis CBS 569]